MRGEEPTECPELGDLGGARLPVDNEGHHPVVEKPAEGVLDDGGARLPDRPLTRIRDTRGKIS